MVILFSVCLIKLGVGVGGDYFIKEEGRYSNYYLIRFKGS